LVVRVVGNPDYAMEELLSEEIGYRAFVHPSLSCDATAFHGRYDGLKTTEPLATGMEFTPIPHLVAANQFGNLLDATTRGLELSANWAPLKVWRLSGSYSALQLTSRLDPSSLDPEKSGYDGNAPAHQWQFHSTLWLGPKVEAQTSLFHSGRLEQLGVAAYTRADARLEFKLSDRVSVIATGQNLLDSTHQEYSSDASGMRGTLIPRSGGLQFAWRF
jgi:iron complex outermembrane receptor protein